MSESEENKSDTNAEQVSDKKSHSPAGRTEVAANSKKRDGGGNSRGQGGNRDRRGQGPRQRKEREERQGDDLTEKVVHINRCAKVVKGGRRFSFSALIVVGDQKGKIGIGFGKANEVADAIRKASGDARRNLITITTDGTTIPHRIEGRHGGGRVILLPASEGTGVIAGGGMRSVLEVAGITNVLAKNMGSNNQGNVVKATIEALSRLQTKDKIYQARGKKLPEKQAL